MAQQELLDWKFKTAVKYIQGLPPTGPYDPSNDEKLSFYSYFKQATEGPNKKKKPAFYDIIAKAKWDAWTKVSKLSKDDAKKKYIALFLEVAKKINTEESKAVIKEITSATGVNTATGVKPKPASGNEDVVHIYGIFLSQPTRALVWFCKINKIPYEFHQINLATREHQTAEFAKINPLQKVPAIIHRGRHYFESHTILRYLARTFNVAPNWFPSELQDYLRVEAYLDWHHLNTRKACMTLAFTKYFLPKRGITPSPEQINQLEKELHVVLKTINNLFLATSPYLTGLEPSIADLLAYNEIIQLDLIDGPHRNAEKYPNLVAWLNRMTTIEGHQDIYNTLTKFLPQAKL